MPVPLQHPSQCDRPTSTPSFVFTLSTVSWRAIDITSLPLICSIQFPFLFRIIFKSVLFPFTVIMTFFLAHFINPFCSLYFSSYPHFKTLVLSLSFPPIIHVSHPHSSLISFHFTTLAQLFCCKIVYRFVNNIFVLNVFADRFLNLFWKFYSLSPPIVGFLLSSHHIFSAFNNLSVRILFFKTWWCFQFLLTSRNCQFLLRMFPI